MKSSSKILVAVFALFFAVSSAYAQTRGIDVSHHQKTINWEKVAADNVQFVYIKATEGATYQDPMFRKNIEGAQKAGLLVGVYHYFRMTSSPEEQFENFKNAMKGYEMDLVPMIDVERNDNKSIKELQKNLERYFNETISSTALAENGDEETRKYLDSIRSLFSEPEKVKLPD